jgi:hypothetical protein
MAATEQKAYFTTIQTDDEGDRLVSLEPNFTHAEVNQKWTSLYDALNLKKKCKSQPKVGSIAPIGLRIIGDPVKATPHTNPHLQPQPQVHHHQPQDITYEHSDNENSENSEISDEETEEEVAHVPLPVLAQVPVPVSDGDEDEEDLHENKSDIGEEEIQAVVNTMEQSLVISDVEVDQITSDPRFWDIYINPFKWIDRDEHERSRQSVLQVMPDNNKRAKLRAAIIRMTAPIVNSLAGDVLYNQLSEVEKNNFRAHIVAKGKNFYTCASECPELAVYLLEKVDGKYKFQDLWNFLA